MQLKYRSLNIKYKFIQKCTFKTKIALIGDCRWKLKDIDINLKYLHLRNCIWYIRNH